MQLTYYILGPVIAIPNCESFNTILALGVETSVFEESMQTSSQKLQKGGYMGVQCVYICVCKHATLGVSGGVLPQEIF